MSKKTRFRVPFRAPGGAIPCRLLPKAKQAGQALRRAPHKIPHKSPALPDFYTLPAPRRRGLVRRTPGHLLLPFQGNSPCADERGVSPPVSPEPGVYPGGTASPPGGSSVRQEHPVIIQLRAARLAVQREQTRHIQPVARLARQVEHDPSALEHDGARAERTAPRRCCA